MISIAPPPPVFVPPAQTVMAPSQHRQTQQEVFTPGESLWKPPSRAEMFMATAPVFHASEFRQQGVSVDTVQAAVQDLLAQQLDGDPPLSDAQGQGLSYEVSANLAESLRASGFHAKLVEVNQEAVGNKLATLDGGSVSRPSHALVLVQGGAEPIFIDGAVRQWFSDPEVRQNAVPSVFVGTARDYGDLMNHFPESLRLSEDDAQAGNYRPGEFADYLLGGGGGRIELE